MFFVRKIERLYEARIEELKTEHLRMVKLMAEEIEYLRTQLVGPRIAGGIREANIKVLPDPDFMPDAERSQHFIPEEEEDLRALKDGGFIDAMEFETALAQLRAASGVPLSTE